MGLRGAVGRLSLSVGSQGKILNHYYERVYDNLPDTFLPATLFMIGATVLWLDGKRASR